MDKVDNVKNVDNVTNSSYESYYGTPSLAIKTAYVKAALNILIAGANALRVKGKINKSLLENPITYLLDGSCPLRGHTTRLYKPTN